MVRKVAVKPIGNQLRSLHMDICWEQNPPSKLDMAVRGEPGRGQCSVDISIKISPDCVAVVEIVLVRVQQNIGVDYHGVRGPL